MEVTYDLGQLPYWFYLDTTRSVCQGQKRKRIEALLKLVPDLHHDLLLVLHVLHRREEFLKKALYFLRDDGLLDMYSKEDCRSLRRLEGSSRSFPL